MKKTIKRTYIKKSTGELITKTYTYDYKPKDKRQRDSGTILLKKGKKYAKNEKAINKFLNENSSDPFERATLAKILDYQLDEIIENPEFVEGGKLKKVTAQTIKSKLAFSKQEKFIYNLGYTPEALAEELGMSVDELLDADWSSDEFTTKSGKTYAYQFSYYGLPFILKQ